MDHSTDYQINAQDIRGVRVYRSGIAMTALAFVMATALLLFTGAWKHPDSSQWLVHHGFPLTLAVWMVVLGTGISVVTIHLYIRQFHLLLKILYGIGLLSVLVFLGLGWWMGPGFLQILYHTPYGTFGFGFVLAALCGIAVKEAFCFGLPEAILFAAVTPVLVLGHLLNLLNPMTAFLLLCADTLFLSVFAVRKVLMAPDLDIGDKSVYQ